MSKQNVMSDHPFIVEVLTIRSRDTLSLLYTTMNATCIAKTNHSLFWGIKYYHFINTACISQTYQHVFQQWWLYLLTMATFYISVWLVLATKMVEIKQQNYVVRVRKM